MSGLLGSRVTDWRSAALSIGEHLSAAGPNGYYDFTPEQWRTWALSQLRGSDPCGDAEMIERPPSADARLTDLEKGKASGSATESDLRTAIAHLTEEREGLRKELQEARKLYEANHG